VRERVPWRWLALGCLLPDVIDKPVFLVAQWMGAESRHFDTARMVGHTAFLAAAIAFVAWRWQSPRWAALAYGIPTHLVLDVVTDYGMRGGWGVWKSWLFWPFHIPRLGILMISPMQELALEMQNTVYIAGELIGVALLLWDLARDRAARNVPRE
jgi:membrane-bound metal-dependent hydrolase YbcI (DUF457 family)